MAARALPACQSGHRHPDTWHSRDPEEQAEARAACLACPLRPACQAAVLGVERGWVAIDRHGIWAGLDGEQRAALDPTAGTLPTPGPDVHARTGRPLARCGTPAAYRRHKRRGEPVDAACQAANRRQVAEYDAAQRALRAAA